RDRQLGDAEFELLPVRVHHHEKALVDVALSAGSEELSSRAAEHIAKRMHERIVPIVTDGLGAGCGHPSNILLAFLRDDFAAEEARPRKYAVAAAQPHQIAHEPAQRLVLGADILPVE